MKRKIRYFVLTIFLLVCVHLQVTYAVDNGAYLVTRTTSYVNPETGTTYDEGTNVALGDAMCASIVDTQVLLEYIDGKIYCTLGFGLMSNVKDVRIDVQETTGGKYKAVALTQTGSCVSNGDTCNHYRFEISSTDVYIRPTLFVTPMGRDVTFYIILNTEGMIPGTGNFKSEMIQVESQATTSQWKIENDSSCENVNNAQATASAVENSNTATTSYSKEATQESSANIKDIVEMAAESEETETTTEFIQEETTFSESIVEKDTNVENSSTQGYVVNFEKVDGLSYHFVQKTSVDETPNMKIIIPIVVIIIGAIVIFIIMKRRGNLREKS